MKPGGAVRLLFASLLAMFFVSTTAHADSLGITLTKTSQTGPAGTTLIFDATLTNLTSSTVFLNADGSTTLTSFLTVDDNPFLSNVPLSLAPGATSGPLALFNVLIAPGALPGTHPSNTFSILGGADSSAITPVGSVQFGVTVSPVPEPGTITLLATGILGLRAWAGLRQRERHRK